ncbi:hypothetical protein MINTM008_23410 [Mycobacterium intracellulare]|jgi:hypothetical protein|nr:hypothetical protein MINTM007_20920 [Mycobacterium intracellulare]BCO73006.1 hypothetical protein MINTM008_23410 [Mycobacterium intracellulare]BCO78454.1 hypothetical protein MINTM009_22360 [Mycobacterium intracellulare]BCP31426.1 hypothetical protein MINTM026_23960 [Mycobacterium intracellulare]BCP42371.1 hypothetical protein MINTMi27_24640 [Mycobacterium intracellulare]
MNGEHAIGFFTHDRVSNVAGYTWPIEWSTTSFYIKSTYKPMQLMKVSLHGPDPEHLGKQHFRLDFDHADPADKAAAAGRAWVIHHGWTPVAAVLRRPPGEQADSPYCSVACNSAC